MFGFRPNQPTVWFHRDRTRSNKHCLYCGIDVSDSAVASSKEHLVGRDFVPTGSLAGDAFNFVFRSCKACNDRKGNLERHVSTVTLFISPARANSAEIDQLARRKAKRDFHPHKKGVPVEHAHNRLHVPMQMGPLAASFGFISPPPLDDRAARELACRHVQGFFSLATSSDPRTTEGTRLLPPQVICSESPISVRDWGNARMLEVVRRVQSWQKRGTISTAKGFFLAEFRLDEAGTGQWFWALEWNKSTRVIGIIKKPEQSAPVFENLPELAWRLMPTGDRYRLEQPLSDETPDLLFRFE